MPLSTDPGSHQEGFIRLALVAPFLNYLKERDIDPRPALDKVGMSADQISDSSVYVHSELVFGLLNKFSDLSGDKYLGLRVGETFDLYGWPPFAVALQSATTLIEFLTNFVRLVPQESSSVRHSLIVEAERAIYSVSRLQEPAVSPVQVTGFGAAVYVRLLQSVTGKTWDPGQVVWETRYIAGVPPRYAGVETRFMPDPGMQLSFPVDWLFRDVVRMPELSPQGPPTVEEEVTIVAAMRSILRDKLDESDLGAETVAGLLGIRADRLLKALKHHGTTLPREIKRLKIDLAQELLRSSDKTAAEIGAKLGYADKAHFTRFFKSQTGMTPSEFRAKPS
ncbi:AraC family transcriptional regulator [Seohaeicola saemankumensis]|nr:AraC family transcriptional regulator [Seohaeicola saemankumensis]MCA0872967.1 AraC family transcriptional regulator [Seohaeicola saemankumensis]